MLLMTIDKGDYIMIGEDIKIYCRNSGKSVISLGIDAPREMKIMRSKEYEKEYETETAKPVLQ